MLYLFLEGKMKKEEEKKNVVDNWKKIYDDFVKNQLKKYENERSYSVTTNMF